MSNAIFPTLPGLNWGIKKTPVWSTRVQKSINGRELRAQNYSYPIWRFSLSYNFLRSGQSFSEMQDIAGFFNARGGSFDSFLYFDFDDATVIDQSFGVTVIGQANYQLVRSFGGFVEPVFSPIGTPIVKVNGVTQTPITQYTVSTLGVITLIPTPIAAGLTLTWSGSYYYRCRFLQDNIDFEQFLQHLWHLKKIEFTSIKQ